MSINLTPETNSLRQHKGSIFNYIFYDADMCSKIKFIASLTLAGRLACVFIQIAHKFAGMASAFHKLKE